MVRRPENQQKRQRPADVKGGEPLVLQEYKKDAQA